MLHPTSSFPPKLPVFQSHGQIMPCQASGEDYAKFLTCVILSGPVLVGYTQTMNDWYDKDLDAINEPYRPIPSGRITEAIISSI